MNNFKKIKLFDTTLRDGSQKSIDYPTDEQAALIAATLSKLGISDIEIGVPAAENQTQKRLELIIKAVQESGENPTLYGFCRCVKYDIDEVSNKMKLAKNKGVNIVVSGSELFQTLRDSELKNADWNNLTPKQISKMEDKTLESIKTQVSYAKTKFTKVRVCFEDGSMGKKEFLLKAIQAAGGSGADVVSVPDTLGGTSPYKIYELFKYLTNGTKYLQDKGMEFAIHAHDDRGLALANSLSAIEGGAKSVEGTLLGSGERVGNTNLKDIIGNIIADGEYELDSIIIENLYETYKIIHALLGKKWDPYTRFVGELSTKTQVGIHQNLENKTNNTLKELFEQNGRITPYSLININKFGTPNIDFNVYTNLSGFSNLENCLKVHGIDVFKTDLIIGKILAGIKNDLDNTKLVYDTRIFLEYLVQTGEMKSIDRDDIEICNKKVSIRLKIGGKTIIISGAITKKDGILGAAVNAINGYINPEYQLKLNEYTGNMHEGVKKVAERFKKTLLPIYKKLNLDNGIEQMGISEVECSLINNQTGETTDFNSLGHDNHGNIANIKALLYGCIPYIYNKYKK